MISHVMNCLPIKDAVRTERTESNDVDVFWVMVLSRKGIKELVVMNMDPIPLKLPSHLFSCLELNLLKLRHCNVKPTELAKFTNLRILYFSACDLDIPLFTCPHIFWIVSSLPKLQELYFDFQNCSILSISEKRTLTSQASKLEQLQYGVFIFYWFRDAQVPLIKCILACSPLLKRLAIYVCSSEALGGENGKVVFATKLLKFHRASP
nr:hypothetical protein [Tanacetum cinerariifolium]